MSRAALARWGTLALALAVLSAGLVIALVVPAEAEQFATLHPLEGTVEVGGRGGDFRRGRGGEVLRPGHIIRTASDGRAEIEYFDGSVTRLDRGTVFSLEELRSDPGVPNSKTIVGRQRRGRTFQRVVAITDSASRFDVETPTATITIRGTSYVLDQRTDGTAVLWVLPDDEPAAAEVVLILGGRRIVVHEGQGIEARPDGTVGDPFDLEEELSDEWVVINVGAPTPGEGDGEPPSELVLAPDGLGVASFGEPREEVVAALTAIRGEADEVQEADMAGGSFSLYRWGHLTLVFYEGAIVGGDRPRGFVEYWFRRDLDPAALRPWRPRPWERALRTEEGIGIASSRTEADAAYPVTYAFSFLRDLCQEGTPNDGVGGLDPQEFVLYLTPELHGLSFRPVVDDEVWSIGANSDLLAPVFCHT